VARSILVIIWDLLSDPAARYTDLGPGYYQDLARIRARSKIQPPLTIRRSKLQLR
jgi:hypothetical protein